MHHMAVDDVAPGFEVTARCPDGVVEAIESTMPDWFAFGTQFHPEASTASALDMRIFEEFLAGVEQFRVRRATGCLGRTAAAACLRVSSRCREASGPGVDTDCQRPPLSAWRQSGQTISGFCRERGLIEST